MKKDYQARSYWLSILFAVMGIAIIVQMVRIQNSAEAAVFLKQGDRYAGEYRTLFPERGQVYDRDGHLLAGNRTVYEIGVNLQDVRNARAIAQTLSALLGLNYDKTLDLINNPPEGLVYVVMADYVASDKAKALQDLKTQMAENYKQAGDATLVGLDFKAHMQRSYPENMLASNVLGFVNREGRGYYGVEEKYNDLLAGVPVTVWVPQDPNRAEELPNVPKGSDLILTIDREIQATVEAELAKGLTDTGAKAGTIVIMNPRNGEILAMASSPQMNPNEYWTYGDIYKSASEFNRAVSMPYEPGSVFKILTMAAAIDHGTVAPSTTYLDTGFYEIGGAYIYNWDQGAWGPQDMIGCLEHSLNVCLARVASMLGQDAFYTYMQRFGIGHPTGIDLANEASGRLKTPADSDWYQVDLGTNSFGQGVAATTIQMMAAASALANDGKMAYPHVLYGMVSNGHQYNTPAQTLGTPISPQSARTVSEMLATALEAGKSTALVDGYRIAGKTGTAQIPGPNGYYDPTATNASFIGWGPLDSPRFMVYIWLEKPESSGWASYVAAPVFHDLVQKLVVLMNIPPDTVRQELTGQ
jgi:cell division protein FtsI/penicillin-binding protein 2